MTMHDTSGFWPRAIIHVDMNAFFASVEQRDFPELQGKPVAVTNGTLGTTIITCSYEARALGIHTGMRLKEARTLCAGIIQRPARPKVYAQVSTLIMAALQKISPDIEVFSVDEAFLDVTQCQSLHGTPQHMGRMVADVVRAVSGLPCSVGVSGDKSTAKYAANQVKPNGLTVIAPWEVRARLAGEPVTVLSGVGKGIAAFLAGHGAHTCGDVARLPVSVLARRFGNIGRHIWLMCQGKDPDKVQIDVAAPKSLGHGKVVPPGTHDKEILLTYFLHMSEKVGARLRRHALVAQRYFIGLRGAQDWLGGTLALAHHSNDGHAIYRLCCEMMENSWREQPVFQVQVTALAPQPAGQQDLFGAMQHKEQAVNRVMDQVNQRYGEFTLAPARLLQRSSMPNVIAPSWKPGGHRQSI